MTGAIIVILVSQFIINLALVALGIGMTLYLPQSLQLPPMLWATLILYGSVIWAGYLGGGQFIRTQMQPMSMTQTIRCAVIGSIFLFLAPFALGIIAAALTNGSATLDNLTGSLQLIISTTSTWIIPLATTIATNAALLFVGLQLRNRGVRR